MNIVFLTQQRQFKILINHNSCQLIIFDKQVRIFGPYTGILGGVNDVVSWYVVDRLLSFIAQIVACYMR